MIPARLAIGEVLDGKYAIRRVLGEGGMGVVYEAFHTKLEQPVAIKLMLPQMLEHPTLVARFAREARAAAKIKSRHVARVIDVDATADGLPYIVMELLVGKDLSMLLEEQKQLPIAEAAGHLLEASVAMREAHARGIVHRDLKPANLFLAREGSGVVIKVLDFGISTDLVSSGVKLTMEHAVVGTVLYMSPEQIRGGAVDARSDIWALGALLYELIAGRPPFEGNVTQVSAAIASEDPPPLSRFRSGVPPELEAVVVRALQKRPAERYPDVAAFMRGLAPFAPSRVRAELEAEPSDLSSPDLRVAIDATATTLDAGDRVRAPAGVTFTADGMATEATRPRPDRRWVWLAGSLVVGAIVGLGAWTLRTRALDPGVSGLGSGRAANAGSETAPATVPNPNPNPIPIASVMEASGADAAPRGASSLASVPPSLPEAPASARPPRRPRTTGPHTPPITPSGGPPPPPPSPSTPSRPSTGRPEHL